MTAVNPAPLLVDGVDVDAVAVAVRRCPGVADLAAGSPGSVASYLPGRRVVGIAIAADHVTVQVRIQWGVAVVAVAADVRHAVAPLAGARRVDVVIADVVDPAGADPARADPARADPAPPPVSVRPLPAGPPEVAEWNQPTGGPPVAPSSAPITPTPVVIPPAS